MTEYSYPKGGPVASRVGRRTRRPDLRWGLAWTLFVATAFSLYVLGVSVLTGSNTWETVGLTTWQLVLTYYATALIAGLVLGLLKPLTSHRIGAIFVGLVIGTLCYGGMGVALDGFGWVTFLVALIPGLVGGGGLALVMYDENNVDLASGGGESGHAEIRQFLLRHEKELVAAFLLVALWLASL